MPEKLTHAHVYLRVAYAFIAQHHRHHKRPTGAFWAHGAMLAGQLVGVAVVGRPVAHALDDGRTAELIRLCTDGTPNACSFLLGVARRAAQAHNLRLITYTLASEPGTSLRAAGWKVTKRTKGGSWSRQGRPRIDQHPTEPKLRWEAP